MGSPKALIPVGQTTLGLHLCQLLKETLGCDPFLLGDGPMGDSTLQRIPDREPGAGPLSALLGWFDCFPHKDVLLLACDMISMNGPALKWLVGQHRCLQAAALLPRFPDRPFGEPTAAIYTSAARPLLEACWLEGRRGLHRSVPEDRRSQPIIPEMHRVAFKGVNKPQELEAARSGPDQLSE